MKEQTWTGIVKGNRVILKNGPPMPDGSEVEVRAIRGPGSIQRLLAAVKAPPHLTAEDVEEWERMIAEGKKPISFRNPLRKKRGKRRP